MSGAGWTTVIGLEVHVQVATATKLFCPCAYRFGAPPNTLVCPVCLGLPGALPVLNEGALDLALKAALACGCTVGEVTAFDRKNYFYPDLPKGYQISQLDRPVGLGGAVPLPAGREIALERIHLEEDAGKSTHRPGTGSLVDLNRCGVPLLEVVSRPELRTPEEARDYLVALKQIMRYAGISECDMEKGSLRCDANLSLKPAAAAALGTRVEVKNLNSFRMVQRALAFEEKRQAAVLDHGGEVVQETRLWDEQEGVTRTMRTKEESEDYRYFPEPDLPPRRIAAARLERLRRELPEAPLARRRRFTAELGLSDYDAMVLTLERDTADFFEATARACGDPKGAANWVQGEVLRHLKEEGVALAATGLAPESLGRLIGLVQAGKLTGQTAKQVFDRLAREGGDPEEIVARLGLDRIEDEEELERLVRRAVAENPEPVAHYRKGKESALKALMGPIMRATRGRADPRKTMALIRRIVEDRR